MGDFDRSVECHMEHLKLAQELGNKIEEARAFSNLGSSHHYKRSFEQATIFHNNVLRLAHQLNDKSIEARAYAGLGHASRCMGNNLQAKEWYEKQLQMALLTKVKLRFDFHVLCVIQYQTNIQNFTNHDIPSIHL